MSKSHNAMARESMRKLHDRRKELGLCVYCAKLLDDTTRYSCASCRAKKQEHKAKAKEKKIGKHMLLYLEEKKQEPIEIVIPEDFKCWNCVWGRFLGDRFFCPFPYGICVKEGEQ